MPNKIKSPINEQRKCTAPIGWKVLHCKHTTSGKKLDCGKCENCKANKARKWKIKIKQVLPSKPQDYGYRVWLLTFPANESSQPFEAMQIWRKFRKAMQLKYPAKQGYKFIRKAELTKNQAVHFHVITNREAPALPRARKTGQSKASYARQLNPQQKEFWEYIQSFGFGWVCTIEPFKKSGAAAGAYIAKYISKKGVNDDIIDPITGRSVRQLETSRYLSGVTSTNQLYRYGAERKITQEEQTECAECCAALSLGRAEKILVRDNNTAYWRNHYNLYQDRPEIQHLVQTRKALKVAYGRLSRARNKGLTVARRVYISMHSIKNENRDAVDRTRAIGYRGPLSLLEIWASGKEIPKWV